MDWYWWTHSFLRYSCYVRCSQKYEVWKGIQIRWGEREFIAIPTRTITNQLWLLFLTGTISSTTQYVEVFVWWRTIEASANSRRCRDGRWGQSGWNLTSSFIPFLKIIETQIEAHVEQVWYLALLAPSLLINIYSSVAAERSRLNHPFLYCYYATLSFSVLKLNN